MAGIIDSEGTLCTTLYEYKRKDGTKRRFYKPTLMVPNTEKELLEKIAKMAKPYKSGLYGPFYNHGYTEMYNLVFSTKKENMLGVINQIEPYLKLKSTQLKLLKEIVEGKCTEEEKHLIHLMLKKLNKRGTGIQ